MKTKPELYICDIAEECQKDGGCGVNPKSKGCVPIVKGFHQMEKGLK